MRRRIGTCLLAALMLAALMVPALAAGVTVEKQAGASKNCEFNAVGTGVKLEVTVNDADAQNLILVTKTAINKADDINKDNIVYINQLSSASGKAAFTGDNAIQPSVDPKAGEAYHVYYAGTDTKRELVALFSYEGDGLYGDLTGDSKVN